MFASKKKKVYYFDLTFPLLEIHLKDIHYIYKIMYVQGYLL